MKTMVDVVIFACLHLREESAHAQAGSFSETMEKVATVLHISI